MAAGKRQYVAEFAVGAKLLGSFKAVMASAEARMKSVNSAAMKAGSSIFGYAKKLGGLLTIFGTYAAGHVITSLFEGATKAAAEAEERTRQLTLALMQNHKVAAGGMKLAAKETAEIQEHNKALEKQGVLHYTILDAISLQLAETSHLPPAQIKTMTGILADVLVQKKGVHATLEDAKEVAKAFSAATAQGRMRGLANQGVSVTKELIGKWNKLVGVDARYNELLKSTIKLYKGANAEGRDLAGGKLQLLDNQLETLRITMGKKLLPLQVQMAQGWMAVLDAGGADLLTSAMESLSKQGVKLVQWVKGPLMDSWKQFQKFSSDKLSPVLDENQKQFDVMVSKLGPAFTRMLGDMGVAGDTWQEKLGNVLITALKKIGALFKWVGDNADWLLPAIKDLAFTYVFLTVAIRATNIVMKLFTGLMWALNAAADANPVVVIILAIILLGWLLYKLWKNWDTVWANIKDAVHTAHLFLSSEFEEISNAITRWILDPIGQIKAAWKDTVDFMTGHVLPNQAQQAMIDAAQKAGGDAAATEAAAKSNFPRVDKFAIGGILNRPRLGLLGESGPEAVIPLDGSARSQGLLNYANRALGRGTGETNITFAPQITINGNAGPSEQRAIVSNLRRSTKEFIAQFKAAQEQERRLSFESGYA